MNRFQRFDRMLRSRNFQARMACEFALMEGVFMIGGGALFFLTALIAAKINPDSANAILDRFGSGDEAFSVICMLIISAWFPICVYRMRARLGFADGWFAEDLGILAGAANVRLEAVKSAIGLLRLMQLSRLPTRLLFWERRLTRLKEFYEFAAFRYAQVADSRPLIDRLFGVKPQNDPYATYRISL